MTLAIALLAVVGVGAAAGNSLSHGLLWANVLRWSIAALSVLVTVWLVFRTTDIRPPVGTGIPEPLPPTAEEVALAYFNVGRIYDGEALKLLVNMMIDRPNYLERISENVTLEDEAPELQVTTRQIFRVRTPASFLGGDPAGEVQDAQPAPQDKQGAVPDLPKPSKTILIPLVLVEKGTLLDGFKVTDSSGNEVPTLSYNQTRGLLAHIIETIIEMAPEPSSVYRESDLERIKIVRANLVTAVCAPRSMNREHSPGRKRIKRLLYSSKRLPVSDEWKERIRDFCDVLVDSYVIVAEVGMPSGGYVTLTYSQRISVESSAQGVINRVRSRLGLSYSAYDIPLNTFALEVEAYHMEMTAAPMQYVFDHHLERMTSKVPIVQKDLWRGTSKPYVRLHYRTAGSTAHLYIRRQSSNVKKVTAHSPTGSSVRVPTDRLKSVIEFREIPPGALGASAAISLMTAVIIIFFAFTQIGQEHGSSNSPVIIGSDIPALILALPGIASIVIGSWLDLSHLRRASLSTYVGLSASLALSVSSALYFLLCANERVPGRVSLSVTRHVIVGTNVGWMVLATAAFACSLFLTRDVISNSRYYSSQVKRRLRRLA